MLRHVVFDVVAVVVVVVIMLINAVQVSVHHVDR